MICVELDSLGKLQEALCSSSSLRLYTQTEFDHLTASPFHLSVADGFAIGGAIVTLWAVAFGWRAIASLLRHGSSPD